MYKMKTKQESVVEFTVRSSTECSKVFVNVYPYWHRIVTLVERVKMYIWRKQRNCKKLIVS